MGLVTVFCPLTTTEPGETGVQTGGETRSVVDCKVNPAALVGHDKITFASEEMIVIVSCGGMKRPNTVPELELPPLLVAPYKVLPNKINPVSGKPPSLLVFGPEAGMAAKLCRVVKPVPLVLTANTVPEPELPPTSAVP